MKRVALVLSVAACISLSAQASTFLVDFACPDGEESTNWNAAPIAAVDDATVTIENIVDTEGTASTISVSHQGFVYEWQNTMCTESPSGDATIFEGCSKYSLYTCTYDWHGGAQPIGTVTISNLVAGGVYDLTLFASRLGVSDYRPSLFTVTDANGTYTDTLNATLNTTEVSAFTNLVADATGVISYTCQIGTDSESSFSYLSTMAITEVSVPEPATMTLFGAAAVALLRRRRKA